MFRYGIEFRLYDGRTLYDGEDRISFVFLRSPTLPGLDGMLVYVEDHEQCQQFDLDVVKHLSGYDGFRALHEGHDAAIVYEQSFVAIKDLFRTEVEEWRDTAAQVREFWDMLRQAQLKERS